MAVAAWRLATDEVGGNDEKREQYQRCPSAVLFKPVDGDDGDVKNTDFVVEVDLHICLRDTKDVLNQQDDNSDEKQHFDGRKTHLTLSADIVGNEVARPQNQLPDGERHGACAQAPEVERTLAQGAPGDASLACLLGAHGAVVALVLVAATSTGVAGRLLNLEYRAILLPGLKARVAFFYTWSQARIAFFYTCHKTINFELQN